MKYAYAAFWLSSLCLPDPGSHLGTFGGFFNISILHVDGGRAWCHDKRLWVRLGDLDYLVVALVSVVLPLILVIVLLLHLRGC